MSLRIVSVLAVLCALLPLQALALININTADSDALQTLNGIGPSKADAIISYREQSGLFAVIADIQNVSGIGPTTYANIKDFITVSGGTSSAPPEIDDEDIGESTTGTQIVDGRKEPQTVSLKLPNTTLRLDIVAPKTAYVHEYVSFEVVPSGIASGITDSLKYVWGFGDATPNQIGKIVEHVFTDPGTYAIVVEGSYARHREVGRHEIEVLPVILSVETTPNGDAVIYNTTSQEIDLSDFVVQAQSRFVIPEHTILLAQGILRVPASKIAGQADAPVAVLDASGHVVATSKPQQMAQFVRTVAASTAQNTTDTKVSANTERDPEADSVTHHVSASHTAAVSSNGPQRGSNTFAYAGLVGVIALGLVALYTRRAPDPVSTLSE